MKAEELFLAIGRLGENRLEKTEPEKVRHSGGKLGRRLLLAAVIATALIGTAFAAVGFLLYDSPAQMIQGLYGEHTGFDKEEPSLVSDPQKPWPNVMVQPGYEKTPVEETVAQELEKWVSPVGQTVQTDGYKLTVDAYLYDSDTQCGFITMILEHQEPIPEEELMVGYNGEIGGFPGKYLNINQYGRAYLIPEKTTDHQVAFTYYFRTDVNNGPYLLASLPDFEEQARLEEYEQNRREGIAVIRQRLKNELTVQQAADKMRELGYGGGYTGSYDDFYYLASLEYDAAHKNEGLSAETVEKNEISERLKRELTPDQALQQLRDLWGGEMVDDFFAENEIEVSTWAYIFLTDYTYEKAHLDEMVYVSLPDSGYLPYRYFGLGDAYVNSLCIRVRGTHYSDEHHANKIVFHMADGTDFVVMDELTNNTLFRRAVENDDVIYMLNSAVNIDDIMSIEIASSTQSATLLPD